MVQLNVSLPGTIDLACSYYSNELTEFHSATFPFPWHGMPRQHEQARWNSHCFAALPVLPQTSHFSVSVFMALCSPTGSESLIVPFSSLSPCGPAPVSENRRYSLG